MNASNNPAPACRCSGAPRLALGLRDAAKALSLSERTVWAMAHDGRLPVVRVGSRLLFPVSMLAAWLEREAHAGQQPPQATGMEVRP